MHIQEGMEKKLLERYLHTLDQVSFTLTLWDGDEIRVGEEPKFHATIKEAFDMGNLMKSTSLTFGEAYMDGKIEIDGDLFLAMDEMMKALKYFHTKPSYLPHIYHRKHNEKEQKEDISSHYDIGNDFYSLWLDESLSYSCGYFEKDSDTLYDAQMNKIHHLLKKLQLKPGMSLLDIGCGWGQLLIEAAKLYHVTGVGITLSEEQYEAFEKRIKEEKVEDYLSVQLLDYEKLDQTGWVFDRVISVGMIEHVGREHYPLFFKQVDHVLKEEGIFVLHYISAMKETKGDAWIRKYIFPGGVIPSLREIVWQIGEMGYHITDIESLRLHYYKTLLCWYHNFNEHRDEVAKKFDERFLRMWQLYLATCAASFHNGNIDLHQIVMTKGIVNELPLTREYLY
ncbi:cyclopropane-fatty-acyl-phospholipid synthase [Lachnospiraceae bacterium KM106-2]|nr:cyclopropane-fatty-acyl-phospholipid synthase [Lachnospiraceae bacterium KM106-2]